MCLNNLRTCTGTAQQKVLFALSPHEISQHSSVRKWFSSPFCNHQDETGATPRFLKGEFHLWCKVKHSLRGRTAARPGLKWKCGREAMFRTSEPPHSSPPPVLSAHLGNLLPSVQWNKLAFGQVYWNVFVGFENVSLTLSFILGWGCNSTFYSSSPSLAKKELKMCRPSNKENSSVWSCWTARCGSHDITFGINWC